MTITTNLGITLLEQSQAQKEVTVNEALVALDAVFGAGVIDKDLATPPTSPSPGDRYIIANSPTGAWSGKAKYLTYFTSAGWRFFAPREGLFLWVNDEDCLYIYDGSNWLIYTVNTYSLLGVNTTADTTNRLAVRSNAALCTAITTTGGGNGNFQFKLSKEAASNVASYLFQTNFSGRAEFGTLGDDNFTLKVSSDGSTWYDALKIVASTGRVANKSIATGASAAGTNQATATGLTKTINEITTVSSGQGVRLPTPEPGETIIIANQGANSLAIYPASGGKIDNLTTNAAYSLGSNARLQLTAVTTSSWYSLA